MPMLSSKDSLSSHRPWVGLEDRFYRCLTQYSSLKWKLSASQLINSVISFAPCAGPVAIVPDFGWALSGCALAVYTLSGRLLGKYERIRERNIAPVRVVVMGWVDNDGLAVVYDDGGVVRLSIGAANSEPRLFRVTGEDERAERLFDATILPSGEVIVRGVTGGVYRLTPENAVLKEMATVVPPTDYNGSGLHATIVAMGPDLSPCGDTEILAIGSEGALFRINSAGQEQVPLADAISHLAVSPSGKFIATMCRGSGIVTVLSIDMRSEIARVNVLQELILTNHEALIKASIGTEPKGIAWVGRDAIAAFFDNALVLIGPRGGIAHIPVHREGTDNEFVVNTEVDGLRIISHDTVEFLQLVPSTIYSSFCQQKSPSFQLLRASGAPIRGMSVHPKGTRIDPLKRYELLDDLRTSRKLRTAARACAEGALLAESPFEQKAFLRATTYAHRCDEVLSSSENKEPELPERGKTPFTGLRHVRHEVRDEDLVPTAVAILRVINAVKDEEIGVPLSKPQFEKLGLLGLVSRLSRYGHHSTALQLAAYGGISPSNILEEWAISSFSSNESESDEQLTMRIIERFESVGRRLGEGSRGGDANTILPYVSAAEAAYSAGRTKCADLLLRKEHRPAPKVAMYMKMKREPQAVLSAVASSDPELVLDVLGTILEKKSFRETARMLRSLPPSVGNRAVDLFACHLRQIGDNASLRLIYSETGRYREAALVDVLAADRVTDPAQRLALLEKTAHSLGRGKHRRSCYFEIQSVQHAAMVASHAFAVEKSVHLEPGVLSKAQDSELLTRVVKNITDTTKRSSLLSQLRLELRIPDRRFFWVCLDAMADIGDFDSIEALSKSSGRGQPPPIGYMAFVETCLKHGRDDHGAKYAHRMTDPRDKARALARCGHGREATDIAIKLRSKQLQDEVAELANRHAAGLPVLERPM